MAEKKSRVLVIGGTGYLGKHIVAATAKANHPTFVLIRQTNLAGPVKAQIFHSFNNLGVQTLKGDLHDHRSLVEAIKQVDVVISTVGIAQVPHQTNIIAAIKEAGNVKKFYPSEFGPDYDKVSAVEPAAALSESKSLIRRKIEAAGIPYTYICSCGTAGYFARTLYEIDVTATTTSPPRDKVAIFGDGNTKVVSNKEEDIATYTVLTIDDARTLNKIVHIRPPGNTLSSNELVALWESKIGETLEKTFVPEDQILKQIQESVSPHNIFLAIYHSILVRGAHTCYEIDPSSGFDALELYPDVKYTSVDEYLDLLV